MAENQVQLQRNRPGEQQKAESPSLAEGKQASAVVEKERVKTQPTKNSEGLKALFGTREERTQQGNRMTESFRSFREKQNQTIYYRPRERGHERAHGAGEKLIGGETTEQERLQQFGWKQNVVQQRNSVRTGRVSNTQEFESDPSTWEVKDRVESRIKPVKIDPSSSATVASDGRQDQDAADKRFGTSEHTAQQDVAQTGESTQTQEQSLSIDTQVVPLEQVVGPEAVLTFKEKLQQVWVNIDDSPTVELDVLARMPANLFGQSSTELLMVESPQGIHFVAFLRNRNDFEILANFDRRELIPGSPSRQLIEAAIVACEQMDAVCREGCSKIGESVAEAATKRSANDFVLQQLRLRWMIGKKRKKRLEREVDLLVDQLDMLDELEAEEELSHSLEQKVQHDEGLLPEESLEELADDSHQR